MFKFELGDKVKDTITGFEGTINMRIEYLNGCLRYNVMSKKRTAEGKAIEDCFDEQQLVAVQTAKRKEPAKRPGGDRPGPKGLKAPPKFGKF